MPNLSTLSAARLHTEIAKREATHSALLSETIAAGYGETRHNDIARLAREECIPLLVEYMAASDSLAEARCELDDRRRYHGNDRPIKRPTYA